MSFSMHVLPEIGFECVHSAIQCDVSAQAHFGR